MSDAIVVGLDDSAAARGALRWAAAQARRTGVTHEGATRAITTELSDITELFDATDPRPEWSVQFAKSKAGSILVPASYLPMAAANSLQAASAVSGRRSS